MPQVRLIAQDGEQVGVVDIDSAIKSAEAAGLDLVEISPHVDPPVCKIMDYGRYKFEASKKQHSAKKKQKQVQLKEIKFRPGTEDADYQVKLRSLIKFLENGDKTKSHCDFAAVRWRIAISGLNYCRGLRRILKNGRW